MASADVLLTAIRAQISTVTGFIMRDLADVETWTFFGAGLTPAQAAAAVAIVQQVQSAPAASTFWPAPDPLGDRVTALEQQAEG